MPVLESWERPYFESGGHEPFLFYAVFADTGFETDWQISGSTYHTESIAPGLEITRLNKTDDPDYIANFLKGHFWEAFKHDYPDDALRVANAGTCFTLRGSPVQSETLNYLRDVVGVLTFLLDAGCVAVLDLFAMEWWKPDDWRQRIFVPGQSALSRHVSILVSEEANADTRWYHTRGMRKFGRRDISVHDVSPALESGVLEMVNRFIQFQILGGIATDGHEVRLSALPAGGIVRHQGSLDDVDFNNFHFEVYLNR